MHSHDALAQRSNRDVFEMLDGTDPLAHCRERFDLPDDLHYFDGNSLGPPPRNVEKRTYNLVQEQWGKDLIRSWNQHGWIDLPTSVGKKIAPLIGAAPSQVVVCDSVSVNLFKVLAACLEPSFQDGVEPRKTVICQADHFPTDLYIAQGLVEMLGPGYSLLTARASQLEQRLDEASDSVAAVCWSHVDYRSGQLYDIGEMTRTIHASGALAVWDLSHSAGALSVDLDACGVDMAVGCGYKFLNGGPGAPAFLYVSKRHMTDPGKAAVSPLRGWLGHRRPFDFSSTYEPAQGVERFICGTPPILSLTALDAALEAFEGVDLRHIREKSIRLGQLLWEQMAERCPELELASPANPEKRGSQICFRHPHAHGLAQALIARRVIGDFRAPDILRFGITPLYQRHTDVWHAVEAVRAVLDRDEHLNPGFNLRQKVT